MRCACGGQSQVVDSREAPSLHAVRRRRRCLGCGARFTTYELKIGLDVLRRMEERERARLLILRAQGKSDEGATLPRP